VARNRIRLKGLGPGAEGKSWEGNGLLCVGRSTDVEIALPDPSLSRRHAEILFTDHQGWSVRDLGSKNGTFLNGIRVGQIERKIEERDLLQFGNVVIVVTTIEGDFPLTAEPPTGTWQVRATTQHSWEEALELLALDITRQTRPSDRLLTLLRAGHHLYQVASLDELLHMSLQDAVTLLRAQRGAILLADPSTGRLTTQAVFSQGREPAEGVLFSSTLVERCYRRGEAMLCQDVRTDPELLRAQSVVQGHMASLLCVLLRTPRKRLGVLHLDRGASEEPFTTEDLHLADGLAVGMSASVASAQITQEKQRNIFIQTVIALTQTLELHDPLTSGHSNRVTDYTLLLAESLRLPAADRQTLQIAAPLHDIGKIGVSDRLLLKEGALTAEEYEQVKAHPTKGAALLQNIPDLAPLVPVIRGHHERWDGRGYPDGLAGEAIPPLCRVIAVADTFDALTSDAPHRAGLPPDQAFRQIEEGADSQLDPDCVHAFLRLRPRLEQHLLRTREGSVERGQAVPSCH
jgi:HD-GYP domain-containing protein (c-di-GMP phosphodiesterase class II)